MAGAIRFRLLARKNPLRERRSRTPFRQADLFVLREATEEMEADAIPEAVKQFLIAPHPPPARRRKAKHAAA